MTRSGVARKGSCSAGCRGAEHSQTCTKDLACNCAVPFRPALESAVQLGQGDEVNRQSEMANLTKYRDSVQSTFGLLVGFFEYP
jgi:hypothetical protein